MKKSLSFNKISPFLFGLGICIIVLSLIPTILLGENAIVPYHDQLDGEIIAYIYRAKYLFTDTDFIPEFMNGAHKNALIPPAPLGVLFFYFFKPFVAYVILYIFGQLIAYIGFFLLLDRITKNKYISFFVSLLFSFIGFLPIYGLSQYGIPMLLLCFINLYQKKHIKASLLYVAIYAGMSSFVLFGFVWIAIGCLLFFYFLCSKKIKEQLALVTSFLIMLAIYVLENLSLFAQILGLNNSFTSHKIDYTLNSAPFFRQFIDYFTNNSDHNPDHHKWILYLMIGVILLFILTAQKASAEQKTYFKNLIFILIILIFICICAALWLSTPIISIRENLGALKSFAATRVLWLTPTLWYLCLALCLSIIISTSNITKWVQYIFASCMILLLSYNCLKTSFVKPCLQELLLPEYETISWSDYFALGVMNQVEEYIYSEDSKQIDEYKVVSLGIDPVAALYHGFYCIDGYSNNYDIDYKNTFREIIAPELDKNTSMAEYFDHWGNRCYLFSSEIPLYYNIEKGTFWYNHLQLNINALKELGCEYILSAAYIVPATDMNLTLMREDAFETDTSYYRIFIYKIN